jgi:hypothetical protein
MNTTHTMQAPTQSAIMKDLTTYAVGLGFATVAFVAPFALAVIITAMLVPASFAAYSVSASCAGLGFGAVGAAYLLKKRDHAISKRLAAESALISLVLGILVGIAQI